MSGFLTFCRVKDESKNLRFVGYICFQIVVSSHFPWRRPVCLGRHLFLSFFEFLWKIFAQNCNFLPYDEYFVSAGFLGDIPNPDKWATINPSPERLFSGKLQKSLTKCESNSPTAPLPTEARRRSISCCRMRQHTVRLCIGTMRWLDVKDISILNSVMTDAD